MIIKLIKKTVENIKRKKALEKERLLKIKMHEEFLENERLEAQKVIDEENYIQEVIEEHINRVDNIHSFLGYKKNNEQYSELLSLVIKDYSILKYFPKDKLDFKLCKDAIQIDIRTFDFFPDKYKELNVYLNEIQTHLKRYVHLKYNKNYINIAKDLEFCNFLEKIMDLETALSIVKLDNNIVIFLPNRFQSSDFFLEAIKRGFNRYEDIPKTIIDKSIIIYLLSKGTQNIKYIPNNKLEKNYLISLVKKHGESIAHFPHDIIDKDICIAALENNPMVYEYLPIDLIDIDIAKLCYKKNDFLDYTSFENHLTIRLRILNNVKVVKKILELINPIIKFDKDTNEIFFGIENLNESSIQFFLDESVKIKLVKKVQDPVFLDYIYSYTHIINYDLVKFIADNYHVDTIINSKYSFLNGLRIESLKYLTNIGYAPNKYKLYFNLHQLDRNSGGELINEVLRAMYNNNYSVVFIHGFHRGVILKNLVSQAVVDNPKFSQYSVSYNEGRTEVRINLQ